MPQVSVRQGVSILYMGTYNEGAWLLIRKTTARFVKFVKMQCYL